MRYPYEGRALHSKSSHSTSYTPKISVGRKLSSRRACTRILPQTRRETKLEGLLFLRETKSSNKDVRKHNIFFVLLLLCVAHSPISNAVFASPRWYLERSIEGSSSSSIPQPTIPRAVLDESKRINHPLSLVPNAHSSKSSNSSTGARHTTSVLLLLQ